MSSDPPSNALSAAPSRICLGCGAHPYASDVSACSACGASTLAAIDTGEPAPGVRLGDRYILLDQLGRGGFGSVYRAAHTTLGGIVAIKVLHVDARKHASALKRFYGEAKNSARLSHPHNIRVFDFGHTDDDIAFIAMDLVDGVPLSELPRPMPPSRAVRLVDQIAAALGEAHTLGLVHRDLKPPNIMVSQVDAHDFVRVLDYGISKLVDSTSDLTNTGGFIGSPDYAAPEQLNNGGRGADRRTDVYALGVVLFEMLCGRCPFTADDPLHVLYMHRHEAAPRVSSLVSVSPELDALVAQCLEKDPERRPNTMAQLRSGLQSLPEYAAVLDQETAAVSGTPGEISSPANDATLLNTETIAFDEAHRLDTKPQLTRETTENFEPPRRRMVPAAIGFSAAILVAALTWFALSGDRQEPVVEREAAAAEHTPESAERVAAEPEPALADDWIESSADAVHAAGDAIDAALNVARTDVTTEGAERAQTVEARAGEEAPAAQPTQRAGDNTPRASNERAAEQERREPEPRRERVPDPGVEAQTVGEPVAEPTADEPAAEPAVDPRARLRDRARQRAIEAAESGD